MGHYYGEMYSDEELKAKAEGRATNRPCLTCAANCVWDAEEQIYKCVHCGECTAKVVVE